MCSSDLGQAVQRWTQAAAPLKGTPIVVQHKGFPYLEAWLGLKQVAALEPKPGVEPSSPHLSAVLQQLQSQPARLILRAAYQDGRSSQWLAERAKLPVVVGAVPEANHNQVVSFDGPFAGSVTAALFLQEFVGAGIPWAHVDLFAWNPWGAPGRPDGGEMQVLRAVFATVAGRFPA